MSIEIHEIRAFTSLARHLNFRLASEELFITQPALTKKIQGLEEKLGGQLLSRTRQGVELLPAGKIFLEESQQILAELEAAIIKTENSLKGEQGLLRIGFGIATLTRVLNHVIGSYRRKFPKVELSLKDMSSNAQINMLLNNEIDVGFVRLPIKNPSLQYLEVTSDRIILVVPKTPEYKSIESLADAAKMPFILLSPVHSPSFHNQSKALCQAAGFQPRVIQLSNELFTMVNLAGVGLGVAMVSGSMKSMDVPNVRYIEIEKSEWKIGLVWRKNDKSKIVHNFVELIKDRKTQS